jgi:hypothetical protein
MNSRELNYPPNIDSLRYQIGIDRVEDEIEPSDLMVEDGIPFEEMPAGLLRKPEDFNKTICSSCLRYIDGEVHAVKDAEMCKDCFNAFIKKNASV